ncbi:hypothetical protein ABEB36_007559 [Hypothenemus hampei]|uniref:Rho-GAP domain-containing protein n=1 Tax=Hypothenemus hampei TaxID=57062 RepID=A0ABD1EUE5_HYPHA
MTLLMEECYGELENIMEEQELLKSINEVPKGQVRNPTENKFPYPDVELRRKPDIRTNRLSKTTDFDVGRKKLQKPVNPKNFDIRGVIKMQVTGSNKPDLIKSKDEYIAYEDEKFYRVNVKTKIKELLYSNVTIKSVKYQRSHKECKEIELKDMKNDTYILHFEDWKRAKLFMENEKMQVYLSDNKVTLMQTLRKLLGKRESQDSLEKRGIYKNEPIFGNTLRDIKNATNSLVPAFIIEVIKLLERPENIKSLGLYRASGNLAVIQKIRYEVDNGKLSILDQYAKDPDVLTGSLKLFFRELKEPLISRDVCDKLLEFTRTNAEQISFKDHQKIRTILIKNLDETNLETFAVIMRHLLEVIKYKEFNKMDSYNLAVCWGPSVIFTTTKADYTSPVLELSRDIVSLSQDATRLIDFFLMYFELHPAELDSLRKRPRNESISERMHTLRRQDSRDSDLSVDSSRSQKNSSSTSSLSVDEIVRRLVDYIEPHIHREDLYRKTGSADKTNKIMKKLNKKKIYELEKYKYDVNELIDALKKYLKEHDCLVNDQTVESVLVIVSDNTENCLESNIRRQVISRIEDTPKKDTLIFLLQHLARVIRNQHSNSSRNDLINVWVNILKNPKRCKVSNENFAKFLSIAVKVFDECSTTIPDVVSSSFNARNGANRSMDELMKEMKIQHKQSEKDRNSRYDNVDSDVGEASILDDCKTENTKL